MGDNVKADWIAVDWGTSHLRAWAIRDGEAVAEAHSDKGMARVTGGAFEEALLEITASWLGARPVEVVACGMVGARQGWVEAPYATVPAPPLSAPPVPAPQRDGRLRAFVIPGLKQVQPADVMRGEETQIAGFLALNKNWDGVLCLPGTHTKWAHVSAGEIVSFRTFMTGEMFDLLGKVSVLRFSVGADGWDQDAFNTALGDAMSKPEQMAARLFGLRAQDLLQAQDKATARAKLSGYLIGAELAAARPFWLGQQVAVIGAASLAATYATALAAQGVAVTRADGTNMTLAGLGAAHRMLETV